MHTIFWKKLYKGVCTMYHVPGTKYETAYDKPAFRRPALFLDNHWEEK